MMEHGLREVKRVLSVLHKEERLGEKTPKGVYKVLQGGKKKHTECKNVKRKKNVRWRPLSIHGVHKAREQPTQLVVHVAREQQAVRARVHDQRQVFVLRRVARLLENVIYVIEEEPEERKAVVFHVLWWIALVHHATRVQRRRAVPPRAHRQLWHGGNRWMEPVSSVRWRMVVSIRRTCASRARIAPRHGGEKRAARRLLAVRRATARALHLVTIPVLLPSVVPERIR